ncbi:hypothetical protein D3C72_2010500 [compost metagenome]
MTVDAGIFLPHVLAACDAFRQRAFIRRGGAHVIMAMGGQPDEYDKEEDGAAVKDVSRSCFGQAFCHANGPFHPEDRLCGLA